MTLIFILFQPVFALAGTGDPPKSGQTTGYDSGGRLAPCPGTGQGGDTQAGGPQTGPRFTVSGDCVTDNLTGLMWTRDANLLGTSVTWEEAVIYSKRCTLCGYKDWRLPTLEEFQSLINGHVSNAATWLNTQGFIQVQPGGYWSSIFSDHGRILWFVEMVHGLSDYIDKSYSKRWLYVWPVRSGRNSSGASAWNSSSPRRPPVRPT